MNMQNLMRQAQNLQKDMMKAKEEIDKMFFEGKNSFVTVIVNGKKEVTEVKIEHDSGFDADEMEMLGDIIMLATNDAFKKVDQETDSKMGKFSNMMPGMF